jgi:hypothetical protein
MIINTYGVGKFIAVPGVLTLNGFGEDITQATLLASMVKFDRSGLAEGTSVIVPTKVDAPNGVIQCEWSSSETGLIVPGRYLIEVEATFGGEPVVYQVAVIQVVSTTIP